MNKFDNPVIVEFPLRGEWMAPNSPGKKVPSHGTDKLGMRYAYDFLKVDWEGKSKPFYQASLFQYLFLGVALNDCYCWGQEIYAPCAGEIIKAEDGYKERKRVNFFYDLFVALKNSMLFDPAKHDIRNIAGNYIILKCEDQVYAAFAHLQRGSITAEAGQVVKKGDLLGKVGHSGNSTAPHLHFQLMDSSDLLSANGVPCVFEMYELFQDDEWEIVYKHVPTDKDRIKF